MREQSFNQSSTLSPQFLALMDNQIHRKKTNALQVLGHKTTASYHASLIAETLEEAELKKTVDRVVDLNRIMVQDSSKFDYELAMMSGPLMDLLSNAWKRLADERYLRMAKETYASAMAAWKKYGFYEKSENFKKSFGHSLES